MAIFAGLFPGFLVITPWLFNIAMEHGPFLDDKHDDFPHGKTHIFLFACHKPFNELFRVPWLGPML